MLPAKHSVMLCPGTPEPRPEALAQGDQTSENGMTVAIYMYIAATSATHSVCLCGVLDWRCILLLAWRPRSISF